MSPGDVVAVVGVGGIGANAIQGAKLAGAKQIWAIDPIESKREKAMEFGATHTAASMAEAMEPLGEASWGTMANKVIMTMGVGSGEVMIEALALAALRGQEPGMTGQEIIFPIYLKYQKAMCSNRWTKKISPCFLNIVLK